MALMSCGVDKQNNVNLFDSGRFKENDFETIEIDHCQYLVYSNSNSSVFSFTHKGNCKNHLGGQVGQSSTITIDKTNGNQIEVNQK